MRSTGCKQVILTESYLMGELGAAERAAFEAHFFDCGVCEADVEAALAVADGARGLPPVRTRTLEIVADPTPQPALAKSPWSRGKGWLRGLVRRVTLPDWPWSTRIAASLASVLGAAVAAQALVIVPRLHHEIALRDRPHVVAAQALRPMTRGGAPRIKLGAEDRSFAVAVAVPPGRHRVRLRGADGRVVEAWFPVPTPRSSPGADAPGDDPLEVSIPKRSLVPGAYLLDVVTTAAGAASTTESFPFVLEFVAGDADRNEISGEKFPPPL